MPRANLTGLRLAAAPRLGEGHPPAAERVQLALVPVLALIRVPGLRLKGTPSPPR